MPNDRPDDIRRLEVARFLLSPGMATLSREARDRALRAVLGSTDAPPALGEVIGWLAGRGTPEVQGALEKARALQCQEALRCHELRSAGKAVPESLAQALADLPQDVPLGWAATAGPDERVGRALSLLADSFFLEQRVAEPSARPQAEGLPVTRAAVAQALQDTLASLAVEPSPEALSDPLALIARLLRMDGVSPELGHALDGARSAVAETEQRERAALAARLDAGGALPQAGLAGRLVLAVVSERLRAAASLEERRVLLDRLLVWPDARVVPVLLAACHEPWAQERAIPVLSLRFGRKLGAEWSPWSLWLQGQTRGPEVDRLLDLDVDPGALLLLLAESSGGPLSSLVVSLREWCRTRTGPVGPASFVERWQGAAPAEELQELSGARPRPAPRPQPQQVEAVAPQAVPAEPPPPPPTSVPPPPGAAPAPAPRSTGPVPARARAGAAPPLDVPSAAHVWRGFMAENAHLLAGIAMLLVGASLVAYFTWDRHWLFRYTIVPALFAGFTAGLAALARWLERSDPKLASTAAMLRGAAIALLPANCMSVSLLADDPLVTRKLVAVPAMAALYVVLLSIGLRRWCGAVLPPLRTTLAPGLLLLNALVLAPPLARGLAGGRLATLDVLTLGFYAGFFAIAEVARRFATRLLTREILGRPHVAWFAGGTLVVTYVQVFVWTHAWARQLPDLHVYGPLLVLAGGLVFFLERRFRQVASEGDRTTEESFVGFTLILIGVLAGFGHPGLRIACLALAGVLWLWQARFRRDPVHDYIGLLWLVLSGAAVALLESFPKVHVPALALGIAVAVSLVAVLAGRLGADRIRRAATEMTQGLFALVAVVATLTQWHLHSRPAYTAGILVAAGAMLFARALRLHAARDAFIGAMVFAVALPYLGFVDMEGRQLTGNTLVMGLALLSLAWLAALRIARAPVLDSMRSTVLFMYGIIALAAMAARVILERRLPVSLQWSVSWPEYVGPLLMLGVLVAATYLSRSLLPMIGGLLIVVALLPAVKASFPVLFPRVGWGTGYGSASIGLLLVALAFYLRGVRGLARLGEGDRFFGEAAFPLLRHDARLFTTPLVATVLYLTVRVDTWSVLRNLAAGPPLKTAAAVALTAVTWTLLGVWFRERGVGRVAVHLGFVLLLAGVLLGHRQWGGGGGIEAPLLVTGLILQAAEAVYRLVVVPRHAWAAELLARPTRAALHGASIVVASGLLLALVVGHEPAALRLLAAFVAAQLVFHALRERQAADGALAVLLGLLAVLAETAPGHGPLLSRLSWGHSLSPTLALISAVHLLLLALERRAAALRFLSPLLAPARAVAALLAMGLAGVALATAVTGPCMTLVQELLLVANLLLLSRTVLPGPNLLLSALLAYVCARMPLLVASEGTHARLLVLLAPVPLATFAALLAAGAAACRRGAARLRAAFVSPAAVGALLTPFGPWVEHPAAVIATLAVLRHSLEPGLRGLADQLPAPYLAVLAFVLLAVSRTSVWAAWMAAAAVTAGNIHAVRLAAGGPLRGHGLSDVHLLALGVAATLLLCTLARLVARGTRARDVLRQQELGAAALVLTQLCGNFAADPNLQDITAYRFIVSGVMALAAGLYFRRAAVRPDPDEERYRALAYAIYHLGVAMALWCLVLLVPAARSPVTALAGLSVPAAYFYVLGERFRARQDARFVQYGRSAAVLALGVLILYVARPLFQSVLFPEAVVRTDHYHYGAPVVIALGFMLLRLNAFEERFGIAYVGGTAVMAGTYFGLTSWRGLSPFEARFPAAWMAVVLAHAFVVLLVRVRAARAWLCRFGAIHEAAWDRLETGWVLTAFVGAVEAGLVAAVHPDARRFGWGALLAAAVAVLLHERWGRPAVAAVTQVLLAIGIAEAVVQPSLLSEIGLLVVAVAAVRISPGPFLLVAALATYLLAHHPLTAPLLSAHERWALLTSPWRIGALSLGLSLSAVLGGRRLRSSLATSPMLWVGSAAAALALTAACVSAATGAWRTEPLQLAAAYLGAGAHGVLALTPGLAVLSWSAAGLLALANVQCVQLYAGDALRAHGLGTAHEIALGIGLMLLMVLPPRLLARGHAIAAHLSDIRAVGGTVMLGLLIAHYAASPGLMGLVPFRAVLTGLLALVAAEALRGRARDRVDALSTATEAAYHLGLAVALWSFAAAVPVLRTPSLALVTLSVPTVYLWARAEVWSSLGDSLGRRYRDSAGLAAALVLACYASRTLFAAALFPGARPDTGHYHAHAAVILCLGVLLLRLHGLGAAYGVALGGALAVTVGSYFGVTAWPRLGASPFESPVHGAWAAVILVHLWTLLTAPASGITTVVRSFGGLTEDAWSRLRATMGVATLLAAHVLVAWAATRPASDSLAVAPLLAGAATLLIHHGLIRRSAAYLDMAAVELLVALHMDVIVRSLVELDQVIFVLLAVRLLLLAGRRWAGTSRLRVGLWGTVVACLVVAHVFHHRPWSGVGLTATALLAVMTALVARRGPVAVTVWERLVAVLLVATPTWLVHFASAPWAEQGPRAIFATEGLLRTLIALAVTGLAARTVPSWAGPAPQGQRTARAADQVRHLLESSGQAIYNALLVLLSLASGALLVGHYGRAYSTPELVLFTLLLVALAAAWFERGRRQASWGMCFIGEVCGGAAIALVRRQLLLTTSFWTYEYDLWASLSVSAVLTGVKQRLDLRPGAQELKRPVALSLLLLPALAIFWALRNHLGTDMVLLVVGLNTVLFALLGRDRRSSPYNLVAVSGFVAFVLVTFWSKLELRVLHAYVVPVGIGVLLLLQLFENEVARPARNRIRFVTLVFMLGSTAYHALLDERYPVAFNLAMLLLCLACMAVGSLLRVRLYLGLGLGGLLLNLVSLAVKALFHMDSQARMTWVGLAVFLLGAGVVGAAVYHKARHDRFEELLARWRKRTGIWD